MELHVWGPGFGLPSIDAQCLAAILYFKQAVPPGEWALIASTGPHLNPSRVLPALNHASLWIGGFNNIVCHLREISHGWWDLDAGLDPQQRARCVALLPFLEVHGQPLIDVSLYLSPQNYVAVTRPSYARLLPWPAHLLVASKCQAAAQSRCGDIGVSTVDVDFVGAENISSTNTDFPRGISNGLLRRTKETVSGMLRDPQHATRIRLDALSAAFLEPLQSILDGQQYLVSHSKASSADCLATGYLCLMMITDLPQPWLAVIVHEKYESLSEYARNGRRLVEPTSVNGANRMARGSQGTPSAGLSMSTDKTDTLPWRNVKPGSILESHLLVAESLVNEIPFTKPFKDVVLFRRPRINDSKDDTQDTPSIVRVKDNVLYLGGCTALASIAVGVALYIGLIPETGHSAMFERVLRLNDYGTAGAGPTLLPRHSPGAHG
ncbi:MAG: hypothetical protein M1833_003831 [Piccolia ochrophora]|nr:MAG: hypothetical protein M1833_003831 [Piccolia ochrophora]